jgi:hypothetical protein|nr:MAG TPA: Tape measure domain protein [Caudoviricetes sp.]
MAENLRFPIVFDLEKGVEAAIKDWDGKYADKLEKAIQKRTLNVKLKFDTKAFDNLDDVKRRLAELKITPLTPENKTVIRDLVRELKELARIMEKIQKFKGIELPELQMAKAAKLRKDVAQADEKLRLSQERVRQAGGRLILSQQRAAQQADRTSKAYSAQSGYLERLIKKMAIYASFSMVGNFLTSVREVTAQFELQRVSLGAILQDANKGEQIFSQIKQFALNSPLSILDMTRYTKQLAAYKIEYDELFEMTKRFADISVGLGVDYQRIVLAAGQTRTATYLRASELKQFTELGVPLLEELSIKLSKMNGEMVSTAEVMDMISKRAISWELVKEVLYDMTDAGGMFYNMQIQQGNTLYGLWQKLGDAASVMYEQIGNTGIVNEGMKEAIQMLTELMRNWKAVGLTAATTILPAVAAMGAMKMATTSLAKTVTAATNERIIAEAKLATAMKGTDVAAQNAARSSLAKAKADEAAAIAAQKNATAQSKLKMGFMSLGKSALKGIGMGILVSFLIDFIYKTSEAITNFRKLKRELDSIYTETATLQDQSVRNFEFLADKAVKAANGSKEQKDALDELNRTYKDILPQESLTIENLSRMKDGYDELTQSIKEYIAEQQRQKAESAIFEYYGTKIRDAQNDVRERLYDQGLSATEVGRFFSAFEKLAPQAGKSTYQKFREAMLEAGVDDTKLIAKIWKKEFEFTQRDIFGSNTGFANITALTEAYADQADEIRGMNEEYREATGQLGEFDKKIKQTKESLQNTTYRYSDGRAVDANTFLYQQMQANAAMKRVRDLILNDEDMKKAIQEKAVELQPEWLHLVDSVNPNDLMDITKVNFDAIIKAVGDKYPDLTMRLKALQKEWGNVIPADSKVQLAREKGYQIVTDAHGNINKMSRFLMQSGEDWKTYVTRIKDEMESEKQKLKELRQEREKTAKWGLLARLMNPLTDIKIDESEKKLEQLTTLFNTFKEFYDPDEKKNKGGRTSDPRLQNLKEEISLTKKLYDEYHKLEKQIGATKAAEKIQEIYSNTIKTLQDRAGKYGFEFELPFTDENLKSNMQHFIDKMKELQKLRDKKGKPLFPNIGKEIDEAVAQLEDVDLNSLQKALEKKLKALSDRISRTKTAKEFYEKILGMTGDIELATRVSLSIYGSTGEELFEDAVKQIREVFKSGNKDVEIDLSPVFDMTNQRINYKALADIYDKYQDQIIDKNRSTAENIVNEGQKTAASNITTWEKELAKAKDYEEQRTDIISRETQRRAEIYKSNLPQEEKDRLAAQSQRKQDEDLAKVNFEEFTKSEDYIKIFENLDNVATSSLKRLRAEMQALIDTNQNLSPENMKTLVKAMEDIDEQISGRGFGNDMIQSVSDYIAAIKNLKIAKQELTAAEAEYQAQLPQLDEDIATAEDEKVEAQRVLNDLKNNELATENQIVAAELRLNTATANVAKAEQAKAKAADKVKKAEQKVTGEQDKQKKATTKFFKDLQKVASTADQLAGELSEIKDLLGISEDSAAGLVFDSAISSLQTMSTAINAAATAQAIFNAIAESNPYIAIAAGVLAVGSAIASWISGSKVRKANKEIERQQNLLDQLEYTYGRLEKAADKVFGSDYVANQKQQQKILLAQQQAYMKQYEAEMSKGKKADEEKAQEFLNKARDIGDQIADMQGKIAERMLGTDLTSAARDFAQAWLDAYKEFGNTADAMSEKFHEMIENMVVESLMAKAMQRALEPTFKMIDEMDEDDFYDENFWRKVMESADKGSKDANAAGAVIMEWAKKWGYDGREKAEGFTGIAKNIAGATSEEINTAAAIGNTLLYYAAPIPRIDENLARVVALMEGRGVALPTASGITTGAIDYTEMFTTANQHLSSLPRMEQHLAEIHTMLGRALRTKGATTGFNTFLN